MEPSRGINLEEDWLWDGIGSDTWDQLHDEQFARRLHSAVVNSGIHPDPPPYNFFASAAADRSNTWPRPRVVPHPSHSEDWLDQNATPQNLDGYLYTQIFQDRRGWSALIPAAQGINSPPTIASSLFDDSDDEDYLEDYLEDEDIEDEEDEEEGEAADESEDESETASEAEAVNNEQDNTLEMPASNRGVRRMSVVDLTRGSSTSPQMSRARLTGTKRRVDSSDAGVEGSKRRRTSLIQAEDLSEEDEAPSAEVELQRVARNETHSQSAHQAAQDGAPQRIGKRQCIICMENFTNATVTACGHYFCHECLTQALITGEKRQTQDGHTAHKRGNCPICRRSLSRKKKTDTIPISFMKQQTYLDQKRAREAA